MSEGQEYLGKTNLYVLRKIANKNTITRFEEKFLLYWARQIGFKDAVVTCGVVYPSGRGQSFSCHTFAKMLIKKIDLPWHDTGDGV